MDVYFSPQDHEMGKIVKKRKINPSGEDAFLKEDGRTVVLEEAVIVNMQQIFKHNYYKPGGKGWVKILEKY